MIYHSIFHQNPAMNLVLQIQKNHIRYFENKMNFRLAAQTLSSNVSSSLKFCEQLNVLEGTNATSKFYEIFNDAYILQIVETN